MSAKNSRLESTETAVDSTVYMTLIFVGIVLLLHHVNYTTDYLWEATHRFFNPYTLRVDKLLQKFAVGGFLFLSGYKLSISKMAEPAGRFILNRLRRIYPLYLLSVVISSFTVYPDLVDGEMPRLLTFLIHALCLQSVVPNLFQANLHTIWFVSNLCCCYLLFLVLRESLSRGAVFISKLAIVLAAIATVRQVAGTYSDVAVFTGHFDTYLLFFCAGMLCAQNRDSFGQLNRWTLVSVSAVFTAALIAFRINQPDNFLGSPAVGYLFDRLVILGSTLPLHVALLMSFKEVAVAPKIASLLKGMAIASYCVFLFHRPTWTLFAQIWSTPSYLQSLFMLGFGIPFIFYISYWIQTYYSRTVLHRPKIALQKTVESRVQEI